MPDCSRNGIKTFYSDTMIIFPREINGITVMITANKWDDHKTYKYDDYVIDRNYVYRMWFKQVILYWDFVTRRIRNGNGSWDIDPEGNKSIWEKIGNAEILTDDKAALAFSKVGNYYPQQGYHKGSHVKSGNFIYECKYEVKEYFGSDGASCRVQEDSKIYGRHPYSPFSIWERVLAMDVNVNAPAPTPTPTPSVPDNVDPAEYYSSSIEKYTPSKKYNIGDIIVLNGYIQVCVGDDNVGNIYWRVICPAFGDDYDGKSYVWSKLVNYKKGNILVHNNVVYKAKLNIQSGSDFSENDWELLLTLSDNGKVKTFTGKQFIKFNWIKGDIILRNGVLYFCNANYSSGDTWGVQDDNYWVQLSVLPTKVHPWAKNYSYKYKDLVYYKGKIYMCLSPRVGDGEIDNINFIPVIHTVNVYSSGIPYNAGDIVSHKNGLYVCSISHTGSSTFNPLYFIKIADSSDGTFLDGVSWVYNMPNDIIMDGNDLYYVVTAHLSIVGNNDMIKLYKLSDLPLFTFYLRNNVYYKKHTIVFDNGGLYFVKYNVYIRLSAQAHGNDAFSPIYVSILQWSSGKEYDAGDFITRDGKIYICSQNHKSGSSFSPNYWNIFGYLDRMVKGILDSRLPHIQNLVKPVKAYSSLSSRKFKTNDLLIYSGSLYKCIKPYSSGNNFGNEVDNWDCILSDIPTFTANIKYEKDDIVLWDNSIWVCIVSHSSPTFIRSKWYIYISVNYKVKNYIGRGYIWKPLTLYSSGDTVVYGNKFYICRVTHTSSNAFELDIGNWSPYADMLLGKVDKNTIYAVNFVLRLFNSSDDYSSTDDSPIDTTFKNIWNVDRNSLDNDSLVKFNVYEYVPSNYYHDGTLVWYGNRIYKIKFNSPSSTVTHLGRKYILKLLPDGTYRLIPVESIILWRVGIRYFPGNFIYHNNKIYVAHTLHTSADNFDNNLQYLTVVVKIIKYWQPNTKYNLYEFILFGDGLLLLCVVAHTSGGNIDMNNFLVVAFLSLPDNILDAFSTTNSYPGSSQNSGKNYGNDGTVYSESDIPVVEDNTLDTYSKLYSII